MTNSSATGGYLTPEASPAPLEGDAFEDFLQEVIVGISGLPSDMVRPRWTPEPANMPASGTNWAAFGISSWNADTYAIEQHSGLSDGSEILIRQETDEVLVSFFGPDAASYMALFRDGLQVSQNRYALSAAGVVLQKTGDPVNAPMLMKEKWMRRIDLPVTLRREIRRSYQVLSLLSASSVLQSEGSSLITTPLHVTQ